MKLDLKSNVRLDGLQPQMVIALLVVMGEFELYTKEVMITAANDSQHMPTSLHAKGRALDFRTHDILPMMPQNNRTITLNQLKKKLQSVLHGYDVVLEDINTPNEHLHIEWDPKWPAAPQVKSA